MASVQKISPCLWFDDQAEEAAELYVSLFDNSRIRDVVRYEGAAAKVAGRPEGSVMTVSFDLAGQHFTALNGGPLFKFSEAVSFMVHCDDQAEIDRFWDALSAVPESEQCGWLKDKYGLSWQIIPKDLPDLLSNPDPAKAQKAVQAMLQMRKIDIAELEKAAES